MADLILFLPMACTVVSASGDPLYPDTVRCQMHSTQSSVEFITVAGFQLDRYFPYNSLLKLIENMDCKTMLEQLNFTAWNYSH